MLNTLLCIILVPFALAAIGLGVCVAAGVVLGIKQAYE